MQEWLRVRFTDYTPDVLRVFLICQKCTRVIPHYAVTGRHGRLACQCGETVFRVRPISEWRAAWWVLVVGLFWRKWIWKRPDWDARMPVRRVPSRYA